MGFSISRDGQWDEIKNRIRFIQHNTNPVMIAKMVVEGEKIKSKVVGHIDAQDLGWAPLSPHTIELKSGDSTILVETGTLRGSFEVKKYSGGRLGGITVFVQTKDADEPRGRKTRRVLAMMEYGTARTPARPLIRPTWDECKDEARSAMINAIRTVIGGGK